MKKNEAVVLDVDVSGAEIAIEDVGEGIRALKTLAKDIGAEISRAFVPLQNSLRSMVANTFSVTHAITEATTALERGGEPICSSMLSCCGARTIWGGDPPLQVPQFRFR